MKDFIKQLFSDDNKINEKAVVGFLAFIMMVVALLADIVAGILNKTMPIHEFIFDGFLITCLGALGIASIDKWINKEDKGVE